MRADIGTSVALNAVVRIPFRHINGNSALLISGGTGRNCTVSHLQYSRYRQFVPFMPIGRVQHMIDIIG